MGRLSIREALVLPMPRLAAVAHGGASSHPDQSDGPRAACEAALAELRGGASCLDAAVAGCAVLEDDPRFNAGTGSNLRLDGKTIEMDAACMDSGGKYGGVACLRGVRNPVRVARAVFDTPHILLAGEGATAFARALGHGPYDAVTDLARARYQAVAKALRMLEAREGATGWTMATLAKSWNYPVAMKEIFAGSDTVGVLVTDGADYAGAVSTGGTIGTLLGRVGDVPLVGGGLWVTRSGAVAVTGDGDFLGRRLLAHDLLGRVEAGQDPDAAIAASYPMFPETVDVGAIVLHRGRAAGGCNRGMAWAAVEGGR